VTVQGDAALHSGGICGQDYGQGDWKMRALTVEELAFVSGGYGFEETVLDPIVVWAQRLRRNPSISGEDMALFGIDPMDFVRSELRGFNFDGGGSVSGFTGWFNSLSDGKKMEVIGASVALAGGIILLAGTAPQVAAAVGVIQAGTATAAATTVAWGVVTKFVVGVLSAGGGGIALAGMARG
jgi:hypothetical protein